MIKSIKNIFKNANAEKHLCEAAKNVIDKIAKKYKLETDVVIWADRELFLKSIGVREFIDSIRKEVDELKDAVDRSGKCL
jgi:hypothetical protein